MIDENDVTIERLCSILSGAIIENEIQDNGDIYAHDGVNPPLWIKVDSRRKLICFTTYYPPDELETSLPVGKILTIINSINTKLVLVQFYWHRDELWGAYWMTYDKRLDARHFLKMLRRYSEAFEGGVEKFQELARC
jgi:hypothetical protein